MPEQCRARAGADRVMNRELATGTPLSHYRIERELGAGGMADVYLAHDTRLQRPVALKLLSAACNRVRFRGSSGNEGAG
jgi:serine/threonine protein kinase